MRSGRFEMNGNLSYTRERNTDGERIHSEFFNLFQFRQHRRNRQSPDAVPRPTFDEQPSIMQPKVE